MNLMRLLTVFVVALSAVSVLAQPPAAKFEVRLSLNSKTALPGQTVMGVVKVVIPEGLHAYQNPPTKDYMIPLTVVGKSKATKLVARKYPKGVARQSPGETGDVMVYEGTVEIPVIVKMPTKTGPVSVELKVSWQTCTESDCMPPEEVIVKQKVTVVKLKPKGK